MEEAATPVQLVDDMIKGYSKNTYENYDWLIRPCKTYRNEYKECTGYRGRFHQYFIFGEPIDCNQWEKDYRNCQKHEDKKDEEAKIEVIESELRRRKERLDAHYANDTWKNRPKPPSDWNKPLPEWLEERDRHSYLSMKAEELKNDTSKYDLKEDSFCILM